MSHFSSFHYRDNQLFAEEIPLAAIAAEFGTPCYVYSSTAIRTAYQAFARAFGQRRHLICYAVKANSNIAILNLLAVWAVVSISSRAENCSGY